MTEILQNILNPSKEFTPIPFWFFNDEPDEEKIEAQLKDYVEKGVNGIVLHPRIGVPESVPYLSESYFAAVRFIVRTAASLEMKIVLYDEGMYPSGSAHGMVVEANPDFASKGIILMEKGSEIPDGARKIAELHNGKCLVYGFTGGTIRGIHFGEDDGEAGAPKSADILNSAAVEEFIRLTHDRYYEELKEYFGSTIIAFFTDEPCALGRNAGHYREWVPGMEQELQEAGGVLDELEGLFSGEQNTTTVLYHQLIKKHLREIFYAPLSKWCESHGIALMGHPEASDDVEEELYFHIPGQDLIMRRVAPESGGLREFDSVQAKLAADIARHLGRRRNANECFGVCFRNQIPWYLTAGDMKWFIDWLGIRGVNLFVPHAFYYSVAGKRKEERPPDVGPNNIWWKHYRQFSDYMKRLSYLMTDSHNGAKVAVLCDNNRVPYGEIACLYENQVEFNYVPVALLAQSKVEEGKLCVGEYRYDAVVNLMGAEWDEKLREMSVASGEASAGLPPDSSVDSVLVLSLDKSDSTEALLENPELRTVLTDMPCKDLRVSRLTKESATMYLFSNEGEGEIAVCVQAPELAAGAVPVYVDLWKGEAYGEKSYQKEAYEGSSDFDVKLQPRETLLVLMDDENASCRNRSAGNGGLGKTLAESVKVRKPEVYLGDFTEQFVLEEKANNQAVYTFRYYADSVEGGETFCVKGEEMVECYCNGQFVGVSFWGTHKFAVGAFLRPGDNEWKLVMTGNAANIYCETEIPFGI